MIATIINALAIIIGSLLGLVLGGKISEKYRNVVFDGAGITTVIIGISMGLASQRIIYLALSLIIGGLIGSALDFDGAILRFGAFLERITQRKSSKSDSKVISESITKPVSESVPLTDAEAAAETAALIADHRSGWDFGHAFLNASVLFCVGAMALLGSFKAGTEGDYTLILTKSILDGFMAILMTAAMGPGVAFSALPILVYQGALTLAAQSVKPFVSSLMLSELTGVGGAMVLMIGLNLLSIKQIKTANFLPALLLIIALALLDPAILAAARSFGF
ncbi:MAG: DUF554 domain-containing protein [Spirochaetota bacterium]|jgi:hypothetical protein|uniref:DUF554 domain-containing protein n=1 Tax=Gracilinema caldarium TaxID=215591 RepID=UPI0026EE4FE4|nr:DUF554 domain-containing protein [Gracilinema caldarium]HRS04817.1 DUF554 domain-containing protein [Treponema sp.]HRU29303.1 DUF554 domain-containing protein [Treponema sp.]